MTPLDALNQVQERYGIGLSFDGRCPGGEVGAYYARAEEGGRYVFKWLDDPIDMTGLIEMVERLSRLRRRGYLLPRYWAPLFVEDGVVIVQEAVPGAWHDEVSEDLVDTVLRLNDLQADVCDRSNTWTDYMRMTLTEGADGYCLHEPLRTHSGSTRRILEWVESVGRSSGTLRGSDLVHLDFHHRNILRDGEHVVAVVDWEGSRPGDRAFDLVTFCFGFTHASAAHPGAEDRVWRRGTELANVDALVAYVAHMSLRRLDWTIRHHPTEVDLLTRFVHRYMELAA